MQTPTSSNSSVLTEGDLGRDFVPVPRQVSYARAFFENPAIQEQIRAGGTLKATISYDEYGVLRGLNDYNTRATLTSTGLTNIQKLPTTVELGQQRPTVADICGQGTTDSATVRYVREQTFSNAATVVAESGTKPEASFSLAEVDAPVRKLAVTATITDEMMADQRGVISYVDNRLRYSVQMAEETQILRGDGTGTNLLGLTNVPGVLVQPKGSDNAADAIFKAAIKVQTQSFLPATAVIIHPTDWMGLRLLKDANSQTYGPGIFGAPYGNGPYVSVEKLWGMTAIVTSNQTQGQALVGNFAQGCMIFRRAGVTLEASNSHGSNFVLNLTTLRVEERLAFATFLPMAFCLCTGL